MKSRVVTGLGVLANNERIGITNVLKAIASKVMKLKLRIHLRLQKSSFKHKGQIQATLRAEFNVLDPFFNKQHFKTLFHIFSNSFSFFSHTFLLLFLFLRISFIFLFYPCLIKEFGTHTQELLPPHLFSAIHWSKGIHFDSCFTMLQEQRYGWS